MKIEDGTISSTTRFFNIGFGDVFKTTTSTTPFMRMIGIRGSSGDIFNTVNLHTGSPAYFSSDVSVFLYQDSILTVK